MATKETRAGKAFVEVSLRSRLHGQLKKAEKRLRTFAKTVGTIGAGISAAGAAIGAPLTASVARFISTGDALDKLSARTRVGVQALSELGFAAEQSDVTLSSLGTALFRMQRRVANASTNTGPAVRALKELGIEARRLTRLAPEDQFEALVASLEGVADRGRAAQLAFEIFGDNARDLTPLLAQGADGIAALRNQARELGLPLTPEDTSNAAALSDAINVLRRVMGAISEQIGAALAPTLISLSQRLAGAVTWVLQLAQRNRELFVVLAKIAAGLVIVGSVMAGIGAAAIGLAFVMSGLGTVVGSAAGVFGALSTVLGAIFSPIGLTVAGLIAASAAVVRFTATGQRAAAVVRTSFAGMVGFMQETVRGMGDALAAGDLALAARIAWLQIRVAFQQNTQGVRALWHGFVFGLVTTLDLGITRIRQGFNNVLAFIRQGLAIALGTLRRALDAVARFDTTGIAASLAQRLNVDVEATIAGLEANRDRFNQQLEIARRNRATRRAEQLGNKLAETQAALDELLKARDSALASAAEQRAQSELQRRLDATREGRGFNFDLGRVAQNQQALGTFSSAAARLLGFGTSAADRTAEATERTAAHTAELVREARNAQLVFS